MTPPAATTRVPSWRPWVIGGLALAAFGFAVATLYPGWYSFDTSWQLWQANTRRFSNLQPPGMALAWSFLLDFGLPPGALLVVHLGALSLGSALIGLAIRRPHGLVLPLVMLWPPFLVLVGHLWIDVSLAAALTLATGWIAWTRATGRHAWGWLAAIPLAYAVGVRHNAVFALPPLLCLLLAGSPRLPRGWVGQAALALALSAAAFAAWIGVSRLVVTIPAPVLNVLAIWDLSVASVASGELLLPEGVHGPGLTVDELRPLVNSDTVMTVLNGTKSGINPGIESPLPAGVEAELRRRWLALPFTHTAAWLRHRLSVAGMLLGPQDRRRAETAFIIPHVIARPGNPAIVMNDSAANAWLLATARNWRDGIACTPLAYLLLGLAAAGLAARRGFRGDRGLVVALAAGAWLVALPLAVIAPAAEWRYSLWPMMSSAFALLLALDRREGSA